jgi:type IX secretion system PorP/SprF family membrane protein
VAVDIAERSLPGAGGLGIIVQSSNEGKGFLQNTLAGLQLSSRIQLSYSWVTQLGFTMAVGQRRIDMSRLVFSDQLNRVRGNVNPSSFIPPEATNNIYPDFNIGAVVNYVNEEKDYHAKFGAGVHRIFEPNIGFVESESELPAKFIAHGDITFIFSDKAFYYKYRKEIKLNPGILYETQQGANAYSVGLNGYKSNIYIGLWYRSENFEATNINSIIMLAGVYIPINKESRLKFMYSYDMTVNSFASPGGSHEISLIIEYDNIGLFRNNSSWSKKITGRLESRSF